MKTRVLIIDDNKDLRETIQEGLTNAGVQATAPKIKLETLQLAFEEGITDIILDYRLEVGSEVFSGPEILGRLRDEAEIDFKEMRIWVVSGLEVGDEIRIWRQDIPQIQEVWLGKPFEVEELVELLRRDSNPKYQGSLEMENLPLPFRVINLQGEVVFTNSAWNMRMPANRPTPHSFIPFPKENQVEEFWSRLGEDTKKDEIEKEVQLYRLISFRLQDDHCFLGQIADPIEVHWGKGLEGYVSSVFRTMEGAGFTRGRFYRVIHTPGSDGILKLCQCNHSLKNQDVNLPHSRALDGNLAQRIREWIIDEDFHELVYRIQTHDEDVKQDEEILYWNEIVGGSENLQYLELPVFLKFKKTGDKQSRFHPCGIFIFDRMGETRLIDDGKEEITDESVERLKNTLWGILKRVAEAISAEIDNKFREYDTKISELEDSVFSLLDKQPSLKEALLDAAIELTGADGGLLVDEAEGFDILEVQVARGEYESMLQGKSFLKSEVCHPIVKCWADRKAVCIPEYINSVEKKEVLEKLDWNGLGSDDREKIKKGLESIGSLAALPIYFGERIVGALSLHKIEVRAFDEWCVWALGKFLKRARWFLQFAEISHDRRMWEHTFVHVLGSDVTAFKSHLEMLEKFPEKQEKSLVQCRHHIKKLWTLANNFMNLQKKIEPDPDEGCKNSMEQLQEIIELYEDIGKRRKLTVHIEPNQDHEIWTTEIHIGTEALSCILHVLVDNAFKFSSKNGVIRVFAEKTVGDEEEWIFKITNQGKMNLEEDNLKFKPYEGPRQARKDGAHVGLAASRWWARAYGGHLTLENIEKDGQELVEAQLKLRTLNRK
jgi:CheY-like chemotaxis protein